MKTKMVKIIKKSSSQPAWYDSQVGVIFEVVHDQSSYNYYRVVENGVITNKLISIKCCEEVIE